MSKARILVVGSSNTDMIVQVARIPKPGETILGGTFAMCAGGKGANQAVAAARAGGAVSFIGRVGTDMFGDGAVNGLERDGINVQHVTRDSSAASGVALIFVAENGENSIAVASGANSKLSQADLRKAQGTFRNADIVVLQLETPLATVQSAVNLAWRARVPVILNPAPARTLPDTLLKRVDVLTPNETEAELLTGIAVRDESSAGKAAAQLRSRGVQNVIVTMGARGALVHGQHERRLLPAYKIKAVDTTAAGDVFNGALAVALGEGKALFDAARFATAAAAISVTRLGAQTSAPTRSEIERLLARGKFVKH